ncbi:hypothetical protein [Chryseobacterium indoltheticum]|uniref:hypothetical protein n=1 Tax=Chryseobacterium indoltheticum TaxID=254 RepID=UPI003F4918A1
MEKEILQYLKSFKNNTLFELELMDDFLIINIDYQEEYIQWKEFKKVELKSDYIFSIWKSKLFVP